MTDALFLAPVDGAVVGSEVTVTGAEGHHAVVVRRITAGERVYVGDGCGRAVHGVVLEADSHGLRVRVDDVLAAPTGPHRFVAVQALAKGERSELAVEMLTELGVDEIVPWQANRSIVRWQGERAEKARARWQSTAREAAKQSRSFRVPQIAPMVTTTQLAARVTGIYALALHEDAGDWLADAALPDAGEILVIVGPEGGISAEELATLAGAGARSVRVSDRVLRTSTAGVVALAQLQVRLHARTHG